MRIPPVPANESKRLAALRRYDVLDTLPEVAFDELTHLAAKICGTPIALITLVDEKRQWFKSRVGLDVTETSRDLAFCSYTILGNTPLVVEDATQDERFADNPLVAAGPQIRFYAGVPLISSDGYSLGTLCVIDQNPRKLSPEHEETLTILTRQVITQLELRRHLMELARSIEEHQRTEDRLRISEAFYQTLVESLPQNILRKDTQGRFSFGNRRFCTSIGKPLAEIVGKTDFDFFPPELASKYHRDDLRVMATLEGLDTVEAHQSVKGEKMFVHVIKTPLYDSLGRVIGIQGIFWDVTQRKKIEEALAYERDLLRALLDNIPDRIYFKDIESRFIRCSTSMARRLGSNDPTEVIGKTDFDFHPKDLAQEFYQDEQRIILTGQPLINKLEKQMDLDGREIWASVTKVPIYNQSGTVTGIIGISRDVTKLKQAEVALEHARDSALESARVKSQFLANMSHEIRTPMNAITGMTGLLIDTRLNQEQREYVETIRHSTDTLLGIVSDILDFSKLEAGKLTFEVIDFELREAVESTVEMLAERAHKKNLDLVCCFDEDAPDMLRGDPGRFRQVLANLLSNAVKFTERGTVVVRVMKAGETDTTVVVHFSVTDTGIGISPKVLPLVFQAFTQADGSTTRKYGGTGLGLTISKQLVELMHGEIGGESVVGQGSTFWFKLPFEKSSQVVLRDAVPCEELAQRRVLVVSDSQIIRQVLLQQLNQWKMNTAQAENGAQAFAMVHQQAKAGHPYELIILDVKLQEMDGLTLAQRIRTDSMCQSTRSILLTTLGHHLNATTMQAKGVSACLTKPLRQSRLLDCLLNVLRGDDAKASEFSANFETPPATAGPRAVRPRNVRVLLAEDNALNQRLAIRQLQKLGYSVDAVADGTEVLDALARAPYDVILMDCQMPEIDGYEVTRRIRQSENDSSNRLKSAPYIIALTANALQGDREKCLASGMNDYLTKPLQLSDLDVVLRRALLTVRPIPREHSLESMDESLDPAIISSLRDLREPDQPDPLRELVELFMKDARPRLQQMELTIAENDLPKLGLLAHSLKGSTSNLGARRLAGLFATLEKEAKAGHATEAAKTLEEAKAEFDQVQDLLQAEMQK